MADILDEKVMKMIASIAMDKIRKNILHSIPNDDQEERRGF